MNSSNRQRIDQWLWYSRLVKTRTKAQELVASGKVRINRVKTTTSSKLIQIGDVLTIQIAGDVRVLKIQSLAKRRGPYQDARLMYDDLSEPLLASSSNLGELPVAADKVISNRPDKRTRRMLIEMKRGDES